MPLRMIPPEKRKAKRGQTKGGEGHWWTATDPKKPHRSVYQETLDKKLRPMRKKGIKSGTRHARGLTPQERWKHIPESWKGKQGGKVATGRSRHQSVAEDKSLSPKDKFKRDVLGQDMSDKYKEIKGPKHLRDKIKDLTKKGRPSPSRPGGKGKEAPDKRWNKGDKFMTPLRAKHGLGSLVKKVISKIKPKPKPKEVDVDKLLKNLGDEIKAQPIPHRIQKKIKELQKSYGPHARNKESKKVFKTVQGKAAGGRIRRGHGGSAAQQHYLQHGYGPVKTKLRSGKPKIAIKGW